jgi:hypothetical protein
MRYIRIKNIGEIEPQALHLVGASTKRHDSTKIGQFGSGNKYAMAFLLRNGYELKVFSGTREIPITTQKEIFRDQEFNVIYIDGEKTSITTEMGKDWKYWQAMRELYCNALDEGGYGMDMVSDIEPKTGETHFYILNKADSTEFIQNFDNYFATKKKVLFECEIGRILEKTGDKANIYRKGIKCYNANKTSVFDYDFFDIQIDENRLVQYFWDVEEKLWDLIFRCNDQEVLRKILMSSDNNDYLESQLSGISTIRADNISEEARELITTINIAPAGYAGLLKQDEVHNHVILPTKVYDAVRHIVKDENVGDRFKIGRKGSFYREVSTDALQDATLAKAMDFLKEVDFDISYPIKLAIFDNKEVLGMASFEDQTILVSDICVERGVNEVVNTIIEEYIHLKHNVRDETRAFQTAAIAELITYMKRKNAYLL